MPLFPKIDRSCPFKSEISTLLDGDHCTMCKRTVTDLSAMRDDEKSAFLASCSSEICVRYAIPSGRNIAAAAALGAATIGLGSPVAAQSETPVNDATYSDQVEEPAIDEEYMEVWVGAVRHPDKTELTEIDTEDLDEETESEVLAELPVVYEDSDGQSADGLSPTSHDVSDQPSGQRAR